MSYVLGFFIAVLVLHAIVSWIAIRFLLRQVYQLQSAHEHLVGYVENIDEKVFRLSVYDCETLQGFKAANDD